eukprot:TRINITY_DN1174_c0_g1_i5.p1 TRINITY_DN1174_c0_g1~~TRINITY_DN1174_c0_g1_i5.p1  ORF type:complete len:1154 (+),score=316.21 TRINITY_DN1174_c0_g1_i5:65-3526(+)
MVDRCPFRFMTIRLPRFGIVMSSKAVLLLSVCCAFSHASHHELASFDLHSLSSSDSFISGNVTAGVGSATFSRSNISDVTALFGGLGGGNFSMSSPPSPAVDTKYFELALNDVALNDVADLYIFFAAVRGTGAPASLAITSSMDGFTTVINTLDLPSTGLTDVVVHVPTKGPVPSSIVVRFTAAGAAPSSGDGSHVAFKNHMGLSRGFVYAAPLHCPEGSADACQHGSYAYSSWVPETRMSMTGQRNRGRFGTWVCELTEVSGGSRFPLRNDCQCNCYTPPVATYDPCGGTSLSHEYAGVTCSGGTVSSAGDVSAKSHCDTFNSPLTIAFPGGTAVFPRLRRIHGTLTIEGTTVGVEMPMLEIVQGLDITATTLTQLELPRLQDVCGGEMTVTGTSLAEVALPSLGPRSVSTVVIRGGVPLRTVDIGRIGGGPRALTGAFVPPTVLEISGQSASNRVTEVKGFTALETVRSYPGSKDQVKFQALADQAAQLDWLGDASIGGEEGEGYDVEVLLSILEVNGNVTVRGLRCVTYVSITSVNNAVGVFLPNVQGSSWRRLFVQSNSGTPKLEVLDLGSVSGGPLAIEATLDSSFLTIVGSNPRLAIQGMTRLQRIAGRSGQGNKVDLRNLNGLPAGFRNAQYDAGLYKVTLSLSWCDLPALVEFPGMLQMAGITISSCPGMTSLSFPNLAGTTYNIAVSGNADLATLDFGSISGGPTTIRGTGASNTYALYVGGTSTQSITSVTGLTNLAVIDSDANKGAEVKYMYLTAIPPVLLNCAYGTGANAVALTLNNNVLDVMGEIVFPSITSLVQLDFFSNDRVTAIRVPNLAGETRFISVYSNEDLHTVDVGSISGGPTRLVGLTSASNYIVLRLWGDSASRRISTLLGFDNIVEMSCGAAATLCSLTWMNLDDFPSSFLSASYAAVGPSPYVSMSECTFAPSMALTFVGLTHAKTIDIHDLSGATAIGFPNLGASPVDYIDLYDNPGVTSVDLGSSGGGPASLTGRMWTTRHVLRIQGSSGNVIETVTGLTNLMSIASMANYANIVKVEFVGATSSDLSAALQRTTYGTGVTKCALSIKEVPWTSLIFAAATELSSLVIDDLPALTDLKFPMIGVNGIAGLSLIGDSPNLPDGCASDIAPKVAGTLTSSGLKAATACP